MPDKGLGQIGDGLLFTAVVVYALAMLGFAGEQASRKARLSVTAVRAKQQVLVGGGAGLGGRASQSTQASECDCCGVLHAVGRLNSTSSRSVISP